MSQQIFDPLPTGVQETAINNLGKQNRVVSSAMQTQKQVPATWNDTATDFFRSKCVHELFAEQAAKTPDAVAIDAVGGCVSYGELENRANQIANYLLTIGIGPETVVGLCIDRSVAMIAGLLGILKAGAAYLPLDKNYPHEHINFLLKDAGVSTVLTSAEGTTEPGLSGVQTIQLDLNSDVIATQPTRVPGNNITSENLAYLIYTSGSSGKPKGVGVMHYNINRLVKNTNYVEIQPSDVFLQLAPVTFDAATFEIWGALLNGARLVLYPSDPVLDVLKLKSAIQKSGVSILWLTAGLFHRIVDGDLQLLAPIRQLLAGGDVVSRAHVKQVLTNISGCRVINGYGPTEGTTFSVCFPVPDLSSIETTVPIGRPVSNTTVYVLASDLEAVPVGVTGELFIGGAGLARGYFRRSELTAESFIPNAFGAPGSRLYRTGDMVCYSEEGVLNFIGRVDFQVKVRGYRIELEEVEAALLADPEVRQAAVVAEPESLGDKRLVAYVVGENNARPDVKRLRERLSRRLPEYMVPSTFVVLEALPLTANGKVDRKALPAPEWKTTAGGAKTKIEQTITEIWATTLGVEQVGLDDDFFDLGGTSLALINIVMEMGKRFGLPLDTSIVTRGARVSALAEAVREKMDENRQEQSPDVEQTIAEIWATTLGVEQVGLEDDFFDLGGTSLALINIVMEMGKRFGLPLDTSIVTRGARVSALAEAVREKMGTAECLVT